MCRFNPWLMVSWGYGQWPCASVGLRHGLLGRKQSGPERCLGKGLLWLSSTTPILRSKRQRTQKMDKHDNMEQLQKFPTQPIFAYPRSLLPTICWIIMSRFSEAAQSACRGRESGSLPLDPREGVEWEYSPWSRSAWNTLSWVLWLSNHDKNSKEFMRNNTDTMLIWWISF